MLHGEDSLGTFKGRVLLGVYDEMPDTHVMLLELVKWVPLITATMPVITRTNMLTTCTPGLERWSAS